MSSLPPLPAPRTRYRDPPSTSPRLLAHLPSRGRIHGLSPRKQGTRVPNISRPSPGVRQRRLEVAGSRLLAVEVPGRVELANVGHRVPSSLAPWPRAFAWISRRRKPARSLGTLRTRLLP